MYFGTYYLILASFSAVILCTVPIPDDSLKSFETAAKHYNDDVLEMSNADIKKKTSLLDTGKLGSIAKKLKALSKVAGPLVMFFFLTLYIGRTVPTTLIKAERLLLWGHLVGTFPKNTIMNTNHPTSW